MKQLKNSGIKRFNATFKYITIQEERFTSQMRNSSLVLAGNKRAVEIHHDQPSVLFLKHNTNKYYEGALPAKLS